MLQDRNVLCISNPMWEGDYVKTIVELMSVFARTNKVLYVDNAYTIKDIVYGLWKGKALPYRKALGLAKRIKKISIEDEAEVYVLTPPVMLSINFLPEGKAYNLLLLINGWLMRRAIRKSLTRLGMNDRLISIVALNPAAGIACGRKFNETVLIYHCYDQIEAADWLKRHGSLLEKKFMQMADAVIVTSNGLYEAKKEFCKRCFLVKNAVNISLFSKAFKRNSSGPDTIVGYIGSIDNRLDYELLEYLTGNMKNISFSFVGRVIDTKWESALKKNKNVIFYGAKKAQELPFYLTSLSVGIIPFVRNQFTQGIYPLKINEYLAAGLPVVSTNFGNLEDFENIISIANSKEEFKTKIIYELDQDNEKKRLDRLAVAKTNSWEKRADEISGIIETLENQLP